MTLERAGNEGGITVNPAPETLEYGDLVDSARELARYFDTGFTKGQGSLC